MPDEKPKIIIPEIARSLLEPFRRVMGRPEKPPSDEPASLAIERTFVADYNRPTEVQLQAIGRVATTFSVLERIIGFTLARLSLAPDFPTMALTKEIGVNYALKAMDRLLALHRQRYCQEIAASDLLDALEKMPPRIRPLKDKRDVVVHTVWFKNPPDALSGLRPRPVTERVAVESASHEMTTTEINSLADDIQEVADTLFIYAQLLPEIDEIPHAKSLSRKARSLRRQDE